MKSDKVLLGVLGEWYTARKEFFRECPKHPEDEEPKKGAKCTCATAIIGMDRANEHLFKDLKIRIEPETDKKKKFSHGAMKRRIEK